MTWFPVFTGIQLEIIKNLTTLILIPPSLSPYLSLSPSSLSLSLSPPPPPHTATPACFFLSFLLCLGFTLLKWRRKNVLLKWITSTQRPLLSNVEQKRPLKWERERECIYWKVCIVTSLLFKVPSVLHTAFLLKWNQYKGDLMKLYWRPHSHNGQRWLRLMMISLLKVSSVTPSVNFKRTMKDWRRYALNITTLFHVIHLSISVNLLDLPATMSQLSYVFILI